MCDVRDNLAADVLAIMEVYHKQEEAGFVDSPGGLQHMGDVWKWFSFWDKRLRYEAGNISEQGE